MEDLSLHTAGNKSIMWHPQPNRRVDRSRDRVSAATATTSSPEACSSGSSSDSITKTSPPTSTMTVSTEGHIFHRHHRQHHNHNHNLPPQRIASSSSLLPSTSPVSRRPNRGSCTSRTGVVRLWLLAASVVLVLAGCLRYCGDLGNELYGKSVTGRARGGGVRRGTRTGDSITENDQQADNENHNGGVRRDETAEVCDGLLKEYGIVPDESWGKAPMDIQEQWADLKCDRVLGEEGFSLNDPPTRGRSRAVVLVWSNIRGWLEYVRPEFVKNARETCPTECVFTNDRDLLAKADAVMFHGPTHGTKDFPAKKHRGSKYVFVNLEPATYKPIQQLLRDQKYMSHFDLKMTYERSSDIPLGYVGNAPASRYFASPKKGFQEKDGFGEPDAIAAFVSNCKSAGATRRVQYMRELMGHANVHSFGHCLNNREEPVLVPGGGTSNSQENKVAVLQRYKFLLAFENNNQLDDYVTEKVYNGLQSGTLPVYWGAANVDDFVPKHSVVKGCEGLWSYDYGRVRCLGFMNEPPKVSDFQDPESLAKHLKWLSQDEEAYEAYFKWRDDPEEADLFQKNVIARSAYGVSAMCRLCETVVKR